MKKTLCLLTVFALLLTLPFVSCKQESPESISVYTLNGTTGFGMAKLINDVQNQSSPYRFTVKEDASDVTAALLNGDADFAALPTNAASNLYLKSQGSIQILAINTLGCLYLVSTVETSVASLADLEGKTVYTPAQNPAFILQYLCGEKGVNLTVDSASYAKPAALKDAVAAGAVEYAVLPEPMVTVAKSAAAKVGKSVTVALNLTEIWDSIPAVAGKLVQGCLVVRTAFAKAYPEEVKAFLDLYQASVEYAANPDNAESASQMIASAGIFSAAAVAKQALPRCNVAYMDGTAMKEAMQAYLGVLLAVSPQSIGGSLPDDGFYYPAN